MPPVGDRAQANSHLLNDETHQKCERDERNKESDAESRARGGVRKHARRVVLAEKDQDAGPDEKPEHAEPAESLRSPTLPPGPGDSPAVPGAIQVFMSQQADQVASDGGRGGNLSSRPGGPE